MYTAHLTHIHAPACLSSLAEPALSETHQVTRVSFNPDPPSVCSTCEYSISSSSSSSLDLSEEERKSGQQEGREEGRQEEEELEVVVEEEEVMVGVIGSGGDEGDDRTGVGVGGSGGVGRQAGTGGFTGETNTEAVRSGGETTSTTTDTST